MTRTRRIPVGLPLLAISLLATTMIPAETPPAFLAKWGAVGTTAGKFDYPTGVAVGADNDVYVADKANHRIQRFDSDGNFLSTWGWGVATGASQFEICVSGCQKGLTGDAAGQFDHPNSVAVDASGNVYVTEEVNHRIQKFDAEGNFLLMWGWGVDDGTSELQVCTSGCQSGIPGNGAGQLDQPDGLAVSSSGNLYVADLQNNRIKKFTTSGSYQTVWGSYGLAEGQFGYPTHVAVDASGNVYVADQGHDRIQKFDGSGNFLLMWGWGVDDGTNMFQVCTSSCQAGLPGNGDGQFYNTRGVAVDSSGSIYVADISNSRIQKFDNSSTFLTKWGSTGSDIYEFTSPVGVAVDAEDHIYVLDRALHQVRKFGLALEVFVGEPELPTRLDF